eukprot:g2798.t1
MKLSGENWATQVKRLRIKECEFDPMLEMKQINDQWEKRINHRPRPYKKITKNVYVCNKMALHEEVEEMEACDCKKACSEDCMNRSVHMECVPGACRIASRKGDCQNQRFHRRQWRNVVARDTKQGNKGWGLFTKEKLAEGDFVIEFVGEVIDDEESAKRLELMRNTGERHFFMLMLHHDIVIDARNKGNASRFTNHSCRPNVEIQKWNVNGHLRLGLFTLRDIKEGEELTIDYRFTHFTLERWRCLCGESGCAGWMDASSAEKQAALLRSGEGKPKSKRRKRAAAPPAKKVSSLSLLWNAQWEECEAEEAGFREQRLFVLRDVAAPSQPCQDYNPKAWHKRAFAAAQVRGIGQHVSSPSNARTLETFALPAQQSALPLPKSRCVAKAKLSKTSHCGTRRGLIGARAARVAGEYAFCTASCYNCAGNSPITSRPVSYACAVIWPAELRRFMKGQHPWRYGESVQIDDNFDASKIQHVLDHMDSDCVDKAPEVSFTNRFALLPMAQFSC